jgi:hypothetical protein
MAREDRATLALLVFGVVAWILACGGGTPDPSTQLADLNAAVRFTGTQFVVENKGTQAWRDVELDLNGGTFSSGYIYRFDSVPPFGSATIGAMQFANSDGQRFNPITHKPQKFVITATLPSGQKGIYAGGWN